MPASGHLKFWGVRGSIPVPGPGTVRYGGNTSCVEGRAEDELIVLDAGTGIRELGLALENEFGGKPIRMTLLITHVHWDHIHGFPFFGPSYQQKNQIRILGYDGHGPGLSDILKEQMAAPVFPVTLHDLEAKIQIEKLETNDFNIGKVRIRSHFVNHPGACVGYRVFSSTGSFAYLPDNESYEACKMHSANSDPLTPEQAKKRTGEERAELIKFLQGCDILILDSQYTDQEYHAHIGWGHGSLSSAVGLARDAAVGKLVLFHHDPEHDDAKVDAMLAHARKLAANAGAKFEVEAAREGNDYSF